MAADPDGELVAGIARGEARAARALVERHLTRMVALARRLLGNATEAEDVAQEVFLKVWQHAANWQPGAAKFETWMHRVALNLCYDRLRRRRETALDAVAEPVDPAPGPGAGLEQEALSRTVAAALARLPERQRAAIVLVHYQGLTNIAAAAALEISVEALESLLARGRRALRDLLRDAAPMLLSDRD